MAVDYKGKRWDVDGGGVACIITPGIPAAVTTQVASARMDKQIARLGEEKARLTAQRDQIQAELDSITTKETDLVALRATVTAEP